MFTDPNVGRIIAHHHQPARQLDASKGLAAWEGVRWLTDRERDEIDFAVKVALRKSVDRVRELESLEKGASLALLHPLCSDVLTPRSLAQLASPPPSATSPRPSTSRGPRGSS